MTLFEEKIEMTGLKTGKRLAVTASVKMRSAWVVFVEGRVGMMEKSDVESVATTRRVIYGSGNCAPITVRPKNREHLDFISCLYLFSKSPQSDVTWQSHFFCYSSEWVKFFMAISERVL